jgi:hypothetical protein
MQVFIMPFIIVHTLESENKSCEIKTFPLVVIRTDMENAMQIWIKR